MKHLSNPDADSPEPDFESLLSQLTRVPKTPGVYLMKNSGGKIIYVGKASNLRSRLSSYFSKSAHIDAKTGILVRHIADFETILTATAHEALILESNLIKRHRPRYNVLLKDGKRYPSLRIDIRKNYPNLKVVRKFKKDGALYFGPYSSGLAVRETFKLINRYFKLRKCRDSEPRARKRPCLNFQINACLGPCCNKVDRDSYHEIVNEIKMFLSGRESDLLKKVKTEMIAASECQDYENAARLRDKMYAITQVIEKQVAVTNDFVDRDAVAVARSDDYAVIMLLRVRKGHLQGMKDYWIRDDLSGDAELICAFMSEYYESADMIPKEILVGTDIGDAAMYNAWLSEKKGKKVEVVKPERGNKVRLIEMALENATGRLKAITDDARSYAGMLRGLQQKLGISRYPQRIECIDNSGFAGKDLVSGIVVFEDAMPKKSDYRKYRIKNVGLQDDYAAMAEVLERRFTGESMGKLLPDILMVDGGKGQLNIAVSVLKKLGLENRVPVIAIAKKDEGKDIPEDRIFIPGRANPINFSTHSGQLMFLKGVRDEAHRFAVTFHRSRRNTRTMQSVLDSVPGIGGTRKKVLLKHFESIDAIAMSDPETLSRLPGMNRKVALELLKALDHESMATQKPDMEANHP